MDSIEATESKSSDKEKEIKAVAPDGEGIEVQPTTEGGGCEKERNIDPRPAAADAVPREAPGTSSSSSSPDQHNPIAHLHRTLFEDAVQGTMASAYVFILVQLRKLAKRSQTKTDSIWKSAMSEEDSKELLDLPIDNLRIMALADKYEDKVKKFCDADFSFLQERAFKDGVISRESFAAVFFVGDELEADECVYIVSRNNKLKQIQIAFRGSITLTDWYQDLKLVMSHIPNPVVQNSVNIKTKTVEELPEEVGMHLGFKTYMHGHEHRTLLDAFGSLKLPIPQISTITNNVTAAADKVKSVAVTTTTPARENVGQEEPQKDNDNKEEGKNAEQEEQQNEQQKNEDVDKEIHKEEESNIQKSKMDVILERLHFMKEKYPDDPIVVNGHSLGGALALIASLNIASDPILGSPLKQLNKCSKVPVRCVAIANPKPGNRSFVNTMKYLEKEGRLQCCCVHNYMDIVPMMPTNVTKQDSGFWHPGFRILLYKRQHELGRGDSDKPLYSHLDGCCGCRRRKSASKWAWSKTFSKKNVKSSDKNVNKQRLNLHNYREYLDRLLNQKTELSKLTLKGLYDEDWNDDN